MCLLFLLAHHLVMMGTTKLVGLALLAFLVFDFLLEIVEKVYYKESEDYIDLLWHGLIYIGV